VFPFQLIVSVCEYSCEIRCDEGSVTLGQTTQDDEGTLVRHPARYDTSTRLLDLSSRHAVRSETLIRSTSARKQVAVRL